MATLGSISLSLCISASQRQTLPCQWLGRKSRISQVLLGWIKQLWGTGESGGSALGAATTGEKGGLLSLSHITELQN